MKSGILLKVQYKLPSWGEMFDSKGDLLECYVELFHLESAEISHENLYISNEEISNLLRLDVLETTNEMDEAMMVFIESHSNILHNKGFFEVKGDNDCLGFIIDIFCIDVDGNLDCIYTAQFWFEDF